MLIQDADLEYHPRDYPVLLQPLLEGEADAVFGNRFHGGINRVLYFWHFMGNRALTLITNIFTGLNLADREVGSKVFTAEMLGQLSLKSNRFGFEPETTIKLAKLGCRIFEVPSVTPAGLTIKARSSPGGMVSRPLCISFASGSSIGFSS